MIKAMPGRMYGLQSVISCGKGCTVGDFFICERYTLPAKGVDIYTKAISQRNGSLHMVGMPMRDKYALDATTLQSSLHNSIKISKIVNCGINYQCTRETTAKNDSICACPRHDRGIWGKYDCVWLLHAHFSPTILSYAQ